MTRLVIDLFSDSKVCFKCDARLPLSEFYKHPKMADGHLNKCKNCTKLESTKHRNENIEKIREYDRERAKEEKRKKSSFIISKKWREKDPRRNSAHNAVKRAIKNGVLIKEPCKFCQAEKTVAHHENYDHKLSVIWLCQPCHKSRHKEMAAEGITL